MRRLSGGLRAGAWGIADQVLLSIANLAVGLVLARELPPAAFGVYVVAFAVSLVGLSAQISLVTDPLVIFGSPRRREEQAGYFAALLRIQAMLAAGVAGAVGLIALGMYLAWGSSSLLPAALAGVALAILPVQIQYFARAVLFARLSPVGVLWNDTLFTVLRLAALLTLIYADRLSAFTVFVTMGLAALVAALAACIPCRDVIAARADDLRSTWIAHWRYGRWLLATAGAYWCSGQAPVLLASSLLTPIAAAVLKACQYLISPINVALNGLDGVLAPRASRASAERGEAGLTRFVGLFAACAAVAVALYAAALLPFSSTVMDFLYKGRYAGYTAVVAVLTLDALLSAVGRAPVLRLKVAGDTRRIFAAQAWGAAAGIACLVTLAPVYGIPGAAAAAPASSGVLLLYLALFGRSSRPAVAAVGAPAVIEP